jgi:hypothetical protein
VVVVLEYLQELQTTVLPTQAAVAAVKKMLQDQALTAAQVL